MSKWQNSFREDLRRLKRSTKTLAIIALVTTLLHSPALAQIANKFVPEYPKIDIEKRLIKTKEIFKQDISGIKQKGKSEGEYHTRKKAEKTMQEEREAYERAFNAEEYHLKKAKNTGYIVSTILQILLACIGGIFFYKRIRKH
jgi:hypothetical protein